MKNILEDINNFNSKENNVTTYIISEYDINEDKLNQLNSHEKDKIEVKREYDNMDRKNIKSIENKNEIKENYEFLFQKISSLKRLHFSRIKGKKQQ